MKSKKARSEPKHSARTLVNALRADWTTEKVDAINGELDAIPNRELFEGSERKEMILRTIRRAFNRGAQLDEIKAIFARHGMLISDDLVRAAKRKPRVQRTLPASDESLTVSAGSATASDPASFASAGSKTGSAGSTSVSDVASFASDPSSSGAAGGSLSASDGPPSLPSRFSLLSQRKRV